MEKFYECLQITSKIKINKNIKYFINKLNEKQIIKLIGHTWISENFSPFFQEIIINKDPFIIDLQIPNEVIDVKVSSEWVKKNKSLFLQSSFKEVSINNSNNFVEYIKAVNSIINKISDSTLTFAETNIFEESVWIEGLDPKIIQILVNNPSTREKFIMNVDVKKYILPPQEEWKVQEMNDFFDAINNNGFDISELIWELMSKQADELSMENLNEISESHPFEALSYFAKEMLENEIIIEQENKEKIIPNQDGSSSTIELEIDNDYIKQYVINYWDDLEGNIFEGWRYPVDSENIEIALEAIFPPINMEEIIENIDSNGINDILSTEDSPFREKFEELIKDEKYLSLWFYFDDFEEKINKISYELLFKTDFDERIDHIFSNRKQEYINKVKNIKETFDSNELLFNESHTIEELSEERIEIIDRMEFWSKDIFKMTGEDVKSELYNNISAKHKKLKKECDILETEIKKYTLDDVSNMSILDLKGKWDFLKEQKEELKNKYNSFPKNKLTIEKWSTLSVMKNNKIIDALNKIEKNIAIKQKEELKTL